MVTQICRQGQPMSHFNLNCFYILKIFKHLPLFVCTENTNSFSLEDIGSPKRNKKQKKKTPNSNGVCSKAWKKLFLRSRKEVRLDCGSNIGFSSIKSAIDGIFGSSSYSGDMLPSMNSTGGRLRCGFANNFIWINGRLLRVQCSGLKHTSIAWKTGYSH